MLVKALWARRGGDAGGRREGRPARAEVEELYARYGRAVLGRARRLLGDPDGADVAQEVFIRVIRAGRPIPWTPSPTAWLHRITTNLCLNRLRDSRRRGELLNARYKSARAVPAASETLVIVESVMRRMPPTVQEMAIYFFVDELSYDEIARLTGVSRRTVGNRLAAFRDIAVNLRDDAAAAASPPLRRPFAAVR